MSPFCGNKVCSLCNLTGGGGGVALDCQVGYQAHPKIHIIRVIFQDQAMYARTSFRVQNVQNWKKGCVFGHIDKFWKGHDRQIKKNACKKRIFRVYFHT